MGDTRRLRVTVDIEATVRAKAAELGVDVIDCDPALADTADFCRAYGYALEDSANCVVVVGKSTPPVFAACLVLASTRLDVNGVVRRRLGTRKASFASPDDVVALTGMEIGGVTPLSLPADLALWVDGRVMERPRVVVGGGSRACKVVGAPHFLTKLGAEVVDDLAKPATT
jgi:prolyl-tRNA editing enzyme YbaK/EbsC (Cys-tRNA(Pro) deacylase)